VLRQEKLSKPVIHAFLSVYGSPGVLASSGPGFHDPGRQARAKGNGANKLMLMFLIHSKNIVRWIGYFRVEFAAGRVWRRLCGRVDVKVVNKDLPGSLVEHFLS